MANTRIAPEGLVRRAIAPIICLRIIAILGFATVWQALGASDLFYPGILPSWTAILAALAKFLVSSAFWFDFCVTAVEIGLALSIGSILGIVTGIALGMSGYAGRGLERYVHYLASTPKVVFLPLVFILFGIGPVSKIALGAFACSFPLTLGITSAMRQIPSVYVRVAKGFDLSAWQIARMVYLPSLVPAAMTGLRIALGIAFSACLVAEMKFSNIGLGSLIVHSYEHSRFADVYALLIVVTGTAIAATALLSHLGRRPARRAAR